MRKLCFILFGLIITTGAFAANLCVKNDAMVVAMNPTINTTSTSYTGATQGNTWSARFSYGTLSGVAGCYANVGTTPGMAATNQTNISIDSVGGWCYCKMLRPALSQWFYCSKPQQPGYGSGTFPDYCVSVCASNCANCLTQLNVRKQLFKNINFID